MPKLLVVATFAAAAFAAYPAAACDWNREASTNDPAVATTTATPSEQTTSQAAATPPQAERVGSDEGARKPVDQAAPIVLITDRH
jgi:hypothetical protein